LAALRITPLHFPRSPNNRSNRNRPVNQTPRSIFPLELFLQSVVDLTTPERLEAWGLTPNDLVDASMKRCREVAAVAGQLGAEAIRWPSATGAGQSFAIFVDQLRRGSRVRIANSFEIMRPMLDALARGASITALLPEIAELPLIP
jgi:hypothetical protein